MNVNDVLFVSTWEVQCGIARYTADLLGALKAMGISCDVAAIDRGQTAQLARRELGPYFDDLAASFAGRDVVHLQLEYGFFSGGYGMAEALANVRRLLRAARSGARRVVVTCHTLPPVASWPRFDGQALRELVVATLWRRGVARHMSGAPMRVIAPSRYLRRALIDSGVPIDSVDVIHQGSPPFTSQSHAAMAKIELDYDETDRVMLLFGFVSHYKGHEIALKALRHLPSQYQLAVVGGPHPLANDTTYDRLLARVSRADLRGRVRVTGWLPAAEVNRWFAAADICLAPYTNPKLATSAAAAWALASGKPLIASAIPAFQELVATEACAELVTPCAAHELAAAIERVDENRDIAKGLVEAARRYVTENSWERVAAQHLASYERALHVGRQHQSSR